ncbi:NK-tumor recognition protein isoform X2 [Frieseomelitta varia]|uniref:NK-tumor recognition protein isoform X2 n=1 Tax=Frieseomelitta varia TaxID=561572 RepID=UPI001CB69371|nr:NK-tumor recognition protein isoform X2 [Frieseomelitta varia]
METEFLNFYDEEQFSDFPLSSEQQTFRESPQDLLMRIVENDFDYMETHFDIANSDILWNREHEHNEDEDEVSVSTIDSFKEDFAKVLTDWQEHIGYLQASDTDEYMDIIGLSMNGTDKRNFYTAESIVQDEQTMHTVESNFLIMEQENIGKEYSHSNQSILDVENTNKEYTTEDNSHRKNDNFVGGDSMKMEIKKKSPLMKTKHSRNQSKLKKDTVTNMSEKLIVKPKKKKKKKYVQHNKDIQNNNQDNNKHTNLPVLEAGDVKSLLEQFEASEDALVSTCPSTEMNVESELKSSVKSNETQQCIEQSQISNLHKNIRDGLPKEVVEKIKTSARKKVISIIPAMPSNQNNGGSNGTHMQDAATSLFRNKLLKTVTNNTKNKIIDSGLVQLDHDYCSINSSISGLKSNTCEEQSSSPSNLNKSFMKKEDYLTDSNSKKESDLESGDVNENNEKQPEITIVSDIQNNKSMMQLQNETKICRKEVATSEENCQRSNISNDISNCTSTSNLKSQMKIHSALAANILRIRQGIVNKQDSKSIKVGTQRIKQMVSVLKKPPNVQASVVKTILDENIVATTSNGSHDEVKNTTVQESEKASTQEEEKKPPRKKLNLAEYRSRMEQNRSDNSRTNSPLQPMTLVYVHHAFTTTEPIQDDPKNLIWSEREIVSVLKPKLDTDEKKVPKPVTCDIAIQTYETVFEFPTKSLIDVDERFKQQRDNNARDKNQQSCRKHGIGSNSNRSKSRSKSKSKSRSRSRSRSRNRSRSRSKSRSKSRSRSRSRSSSNRSRSRKRNNTRQRRISHRRSSVSSSSSWSSRSHSHSRSRSRSRFRSCSRSHSRSHFRYRSRSRTRSSFSSESRYSRSRSRSSRSRSPSSSRYSSCSRSSSRSNFGRNKWSKRRKSNRRHYTSYDRHKQHSTTRYHSYRDWKRSPSTSYRRSYDNWYDREKQKQVEERRVIYVGRLDEGITKADLRRRFETFGPVVDISIHFREHGDNYGFVTFAYKNDAYEAVEHGNDDPALPRYDLCFGGRRAFCKVKYADLDGMASSSFNNGYMLQGGEDNTFDLLLKEAKAKLRKRNV